MPRQKALFVQGRGYLSFTLSSPKDDTRSASDMVTSLNTFRDSSSKFATTGSPQVAVGTLSVTRKPLATVSSKDARWTQERLILCKMFPYSYSDGPSVAEGGRHGYRALPATQNEKIKRKTANND
ncbi:hypothetical protein MRB53_040484 [Persea americana]|nr:hypothetical protein MRB53_040484 [Persea americana]